MFGDGYDDSDWVDSLSDEEFVRLVKEAGRESWEKERNVRRDNQGRLNKGARIAQKKRCDKREILELYRKGMTAKEIVDQRGCSKSTVYNVIKEHNNEKLYLLYMSGYSVEEVACMQHCTEKSVVSAIREVLKRGVGASILEICNPTGNEDDK